MFLLPVCLAVFKAMPKRFRIMKSPHWIEAHVHAYRYFNGVTRIVVPDNLKIGIIKNTRTELILNRSYYEMAELLWNSHYSGQTLLTQG